MNRRISMDNLMEIVRSGWAVRTGIDVYNRKGVLLLGRDVLVDRVTTLKRLKNAGIRFVPLNTAFHGGIWDADGNRIELDSDGMIRFGAKEEKKAGGNWDQNRDQKRDRVEQRLAEIEALKREAARKYAQARESFKKVFKDIRETGGEFDFPEVEAAVSELVTYLVAEDHPFSFLTREIFSYDDYLYNHAVNVCAMGTAIVNRFNERFSGTVGTLLKKESGTDQRTGAVCLDHPADISLGFFLHDIGKTAVPDAILHKKGRLSPAQFAEVKKHSSDYGIRILERNRLKNAVVKNIVQYHHAPVYKAEKSGYPSDRTSSQVPVYVRICKLADIYDAMTSRRCYREAVNPVNAVTRILRTYAKKDPLLQYILHAFISSVGIYPAGSIVFLTSGQMAYVLDSRGPVVLPFTDRSKKILKRKPDPILISPSREEGRIRIDTELSIQTPRQVHAFLPPYIKKIVEKPWN